MSKRRPRCKSWRFIGAEIPTERHLPVGRDHAVWTICHAPVEPGQIRCEACARALIGCPNRLLRLELAREPEVEMWVLAALTTDGDSVVSDVARGRWEARGGAAVITAVAAPPAPSSSPASPHTVPDDPWA